MAKVTVFTSARMAAIEAAAIVSGVINGSGRLILQRNDGTTLDAGAVLGTVPAASTSVAGLVALATGTEAQIGTDSNKAVTPSALAAVAASNSDVSTGTATNRFVTPASLVSRLATTAVVGLIRLATNAEAQAGTATDRAITPAALASLVGTGVGYRYGGTIAFTTSGTFTKATYPGLRAVRVRGNGSGAAGGGVLAAAAGAHAAGGGGGAGAYAESLILASALASSEAITIGNAGTGVSGSVGGNGSACSFGTWVVAGGGLGGAGQASTTVYIMGVPGAGGTATAGDLRFPGAPGLAGTGNASLGIGGQGANSPFGAGGLPTYTGSSGGNVPGSDATGYGAGGSGGVAAASGAATTGGDGTKGIILVELYY